MIFRPGDYLAKRTKFKCVMANFGGIGGAGSVPGN